MLAAINEMKTSETGHVAGEQIPMNCNAAVDECMLGDWYQSGMSTRTGKSFRGRLTDYQRDELLLQLVEQFQGMNEQLRSLNARVGDL